MSVTEELLARHQNETIAKVMALLWTGYNEYCDSFAQIIQCVADRFENRDWKGIHEDTVKRLDLYSAVVGRTCQLVLDCMGLDAQNPIFWKIIKPRFADSITNRHDAELAATFYNSVNRRILQTVGIEPELEFIAPQPAVTSPADHDSLFFTLKTKQITEKTIEKILQRFAFRTPFADLQTDARLCREHLDLTLKNKVVTKTPLQIEMVQSIFYREMGAYLIGRITWKGGHIPIVFALGNTDKGLYVDALLLRTEEVRILFSFSHTYFHVQTSCPYELVHFLKTLMPTKRIAELYISLGYNKHGKTELYRELLKHQNVCSQDLFDFSAGQRGMVMVVFNMPEDDLVYKLIRDRFATPKHATRQQVMDKYDYVFKHDRAGRLIDVQTFENLQIEQCCFTPELLSEIKTQTQRTTTVNEDQVVLHHIYVERRLIPLDVYLKEADAETAKAAVIDYGRAIKDLAHINVFPGDMLIKNFGVTQLGRVVFYDYDELCPLTDCNFRRLPQARGYEDEMAAEPWFMVGENDVFPEEFASFLALAPDLREIFLKYHGDLLTPEFWQQTQNHIRAGVLKPILPYSEAQRLRRAGV